MYSDPTTNDKCPCSYESILQDRILESADLKKTSFYGSNMEAHAKHGQHTSQHRKPGPRLAERDGDNHHSPQDPESFIKHRLRVESQFYASRIPRYGRYAHFSQFVLIGGSLSQSALAFGNASSWAALISSSVAAVGAYMVFNGSREKMDRYSNTKNSLWQLETWWRALPPVEQQSVKNVDTLISATEDILRNERQAWFSTTVELPSMNGDGVDGQESEVTQGSPTKIIPT